MNVLDVLVKLNVLVKFLTGIKLAAKTIYFAFRSKFGIKWTHNVLSSNPRLIHFLYVKVPEGDPSRFTNSKVAVFDDEKRQQVQKCTQFDFIRNNFFHLSCRVYPPYQCFMLVNFNIPAPSMSQFCFWNKIKNKMK
jgi:hypothetical protein